jgi:raffinose/stachyose/melibiose transport system substrate-binding protein
MNSRKLVSLTLVIVSLLILLVAPRCAPATKAPPVETPTLKEEPTEKPAEKVKIVHWSMFSPGEPLQLVLEQATKDFMQENPDIEVEVKWAGRVVLPETQSAIAAGTQVDIVDMADDYVYSALVVTGLAYPLDEYLDEKAYDSDKAWKDTFLPGTLDFGKGPDGKHYIIPRDYYISAYFYNKGMLDELGLHPDPVNTTWDEFVNILDTIKTKKNIAPISIDGTLSYFNNWYPYYFSLRLAGKDAVNEAAYDKTGEKWGQPEFLKAAEMVRWLTDNGYFQEGYEASVWPACQTLWVNGETAMVFVGAWLPNEMSQQIPEGFDIDLFAFPTIEGGKGNEWQEHWSNGYAVLKATKHPEAAAKYLKYITSLKIAQRIVDLGTPMALVDAPAPKFLDNEYTILKGKSLMTQRDGLRRDITEWFETVYNVCADKLIARQLSPEEYVACMKTESSAYWARK